MPGQKTIQVSIKYRREVRVGSQESLLGDILADVGRLKQDTAFGNAYRQVYSDKSKVTPDAAKKLLNQGQTILVVGDGATSNTKSRVVTPDQLAGLLNKAIEDDKKIGQEAKPLDENGKPRPFKPEDVTLDAKGQWPVTNSKTGGTAQQWVQHPSVLGSTPVQMTPEDLEKIDQLESDANALGVSARDLISCHSLTVTPSIVAQGTRVFVLWQGDEISDSTKLLSGMEDALRDTGPRPGGENYLPNPIKPFSPVSQFTSFENSNFGIDNPVQAFDQYRVAHPDNANLQKQDNYAVLRVVSGFTPAAGDLLAPTKRAADFKVIFQTNKFLLENVQEAQAERIALVETFGETLLYAFGERPKMYTYSGTLMDTQGLNWLNEWREAYRTKFRATASLKLKARVFLIYRDVAREGIIVANLAALNAGDLGSGKFSFQMFVMKEYFLDGRPKIDSQNDLSSGLLISPVDRDEPKYVLASLIDDTPDPSVPSATDKSPGARQLRAAIAAEEAIIARRTADIEARIRKDAFDGSQYVRSSGYFTLRLAEADVTSATKSYNERLYDESYTPPTSTRIMEEQVESPR